MKGRRRRDDRRSASGPGASRQHWRLERSSRDGGCWGALRAATASRKASFGMPKEVMAFEKGRDLGSFLRSALYSSTFVPGGEETCSSLL